MLIKKIMSANNEVIEEFSPTVVRDITVPSEDGFAVDKKHLKVVREGMRRVANTERGTARWWKIPGIEIAGKTGTSQVISFSADEIYDKCDQRPIHLRHHGTFIGYAPAENPEIIVGALTEHSCAGSSGSAPIVRDIIKAYFEKFKPEMIKTKEKLKAETTPVVPANIGEAAD
jgi:penicillin-binding protein 2